jgi:hypothetical protein
VIKEDVVVLLGFLPSEVPTLEEMMIQSPFSLSDVVVVDCDFKSLDQIMH